MRLALVVMMLLGCGKGDDAKQAARKAKDVAVDTAETVKTKAADMKTAALDKASEMTGAVGETAASAYATGQRAKVELDKVYESAHDYDLAVDDVSATSPEGAAHGERLAKMPTITVGDATVGYEEDATRSVGGVTRSKHFRASWRRGDKIVRVSYFTSERIDAVAFAQLLQKLVPIVERIL